MLGQGEHHMLAHQPNHQITFTHTLRTNHTNTSTYLESTTASRSYPRKMESYYSVLLHKHLEGRMHYMHLITMKGKFEERIIRSKQFPLLKLDWLFVSYPVTMKRVLKISVLTKLHLNCNTAKDFLWPY